MDKKVSVIIRTKNEAKWIDKCLREIQNQNYPNFEVIVVDNNSTDNTLDIVAKYPLLVTKLVLINEFNYSKSLNKGIEKSKGEFIACLSGHCIPKDEQWLSNLVKNFDTKLVAGVYGRQEPLPSTPDLDKRDLWLTFGKDKKIQKSDPFFHNANSMIRKELWERHKFDEKMEGQEDRAWAKKMLDMGKIIIYEPKASVYHHHGIHHELDRERAKRVVKAIEGIENGD